MAVVENRKVGSLESHGRVIVACLSPWLGTVAISEFARCSRLVRNKHIAQSFFFLPLDKGRGSLDILSPNIRRSENDSVLLKKISKNPNPQI